MNKFLNSNSNWIQLAWIAIEYKVQNKQIVIVHFLLGKIAGKKSEKEVKGKRKERRAVVDARQPRWQVGCGVGRPLTRVKLTRCQRLRASTTIHLINK